MVQSLRLGAKSMCSFYAGYHSEDAMSGNCKERLYRGGLSESTN